MDKNKVIAEDFPVYRSMFDLMNVGKCDTTRRIVFNELMKTFEPYTIEGIESRPDGEFRSETFRHIAQKYTFKSRLLVINVEIGSEGYEVDLGDDVKLIFRFVRKMNGGIVHPSNREENWLYLILLYRNTMNRHCPFAKVKKFLAYLKEMNNCPIEKVFYRPHGVSEWRHFDVLKICNRENATTERLTRAYQRKFNSTPMKMLDDEGSPYWQIPF
jgi:hypothetical protein